MSEFNFKSQKCTTREQSERLLSLGLKPETADMHYSTDHRGNIRQLWLLAYGDLHEDVQAHSLPAWSLHRLLELNLLCCEQHFAFQFHITNIDNAYEYLVNHTEWLIKEGYFNNEYLV